MKKETTKSKKDEAETPAENQAPATPDEQSKAPGPEAEGREPKEDWHRTAPIPRGKLCKMPAKVVGKIAEFMSAPIAESVIPAEYSIYGAQYLVRMAEGKIVLTVVPKHYELTSAETGLDQAHKEHSWAKVRHQNADSEHTLEALKDAEAALERAERAVKKAKKASRPTSFVFDFGEDLLFGVAEE